MNQENEDPKNHPIFETIIIGGGPAGLTAGLYLSRSRVKTLLLDKGLPGGQANLTELIENYPGFPEGIIGPELMQLFEKQAKKFGLEIRIESALEIEDQNRNKDKLFLIATDSGSLYGKTVILASGAQPRQLNVPGENEFRGRGVSYCGTCDGAFFRNKEIVVVGGGDTAIEEALYLTKFASKVSIVHRRNELRAIKILQERAFANQKIHFIWDSVILEITGSQQVDAVKLKNIISGGENIFPCQGVFIFTGYLPTYPSLKLLSKNILSEKNYIITKENMMTNIPGLFACGDVREKTLRQVVTACGEGAVAAYSVERYLENRSA